MQCNLITIPLPCLVDSDANVCTGELPNIPTLVVTIRIHGLIHPLVVTGVGRDHRTCYPVATGRRRRAALELLRGQDTIDADHEVLCLLAESEAEIPELSTTENTEREDMHSADEYEAFRRVVGAGTSIEDMAACYGIMPAVMEQRLKLVKVSPALVAAYRADDMSLEQLMTMTITNDRAAQEQVREFQPHHERTPEKLRHALLGRDTVRSDSPLTTYVNRDAYLATGGCMQMDLFQFAAYWLDGALVRDMVLGRVDTEAEAIRTAEGWAWALALLNPSYSDMDAFGHASTTLREPAKREAAAIKELDACKAKIKRDMGNMEERGEEEFETYATLSNGWDKIESELNDLSSQIQIVADKSLAGVVILLQHNTVKILYGSIKPKDRKTATKIERAVTHAISDDGGDTDAAPAPTLPERLARALTTQRTTVLQAVLIERTDVVLATLVYGLVSSLWSGRYWRADAVGVHTTDMRYTVTRADTSIETSHAWQQIETVGEAWKTRLPKELDALWPVLLTMPHDELLSLLAFCTAVTVNGIQPRAGEHKVDVIARSVALDMADWWGATTRNYLLHVPKAQVLATVTEDVDAVGATPLVAMKKGQMVEAAARAFAGER